MIWLSALGWLRSALRAALALAVKYPLQVALCASLLACGYLWRGWTHERADYAAYRRQAAASVLHLEQEKAATEARQAQITKDTDHATQPARDHALAAADAYARTHRLPAPASPATGPASAGLSEPAAAAGSAEAAAGSSELVSITRSDLDKCTVIGSDFSVAFGWAQRTYGSN